MAMTVYAFGSGLDTGVPTGANCTENTGTVNIADEVTGCVRISGGGGSDVSIYAQEPTTHALTSLTEGWVHFRFRTGWCGASGLDPFSFYNAAGTQVFRIRSTAGGFAWTFNCQYWDGSAWQTAFTGTWPSDNTERVCDINFKVHGSTGFIELFIGGISVGSATGLNTSGMSNVRQVKLTNGNDQDYLFWGWIIADESTIGHKVRERLATGNGSHTAWTGDYLDIDEKPLNDSDLISTSSAGDKETFTATNFAAISAGNIVKAVGIGARAKTSGGAPTSLRGLMRIGGVDYTTPDALGVGAGWTSCALFFPEDPSTSAPWTAVLTNVNVAFGVEART